MGGREPLKKIHYPNFLIAATQPLTALGVNLGPLKNLNSLHHAVIFFVTNFPVEGEYQDSELEPFFIQFATKS